MGKNYTSILSAVRDTIHGGKLSVEQIADHLAVSPNLVYRMALEENGDGFVRHLQRAVALMAATKNYSIIETICRQCGGYFSREPKRGASKVVREVEIANFNLQHALLLKSFSLLLAAPSRALKREFDKALDEHISQVLAMKKMAQVDINQLSLFEAN